MTYDEQQKRLKKLAKQKRFSRDDLLFMIEVLQSQMAIEGFSRVLDWKESLGFDR